MVLSVSFVYNPNALSFSLLFCFNFTFRSGIEQAPGAISNDNITDSIRTIPSAETIRPKDINLDGEFEPCSICLSLINTELIFDFDFILISVMPCCLLKLMKL
jgi:hypothetical protein